MGQILKFFGWLVLTIALTLVIFGHIMMVIIYSTDYLMDTLFPSNPDDLSSIWVIMGSVLPGATLWLLGAALQKFGTPEDEDLAPDANDAKDDNDTPQAES